MDDLSLVTKDNCTYHIVFIPKYRRKAMYSTVRSEIGKNIKYFCRLEGVELSNGAMCIDHVQVYVSDPPRKNVASIMSRIKGKSVFYVV